MKIEFLDQNPFINDAQNHGDCILIWAPDGEKVLIDGGIAEVADPLKNELRRRDFCTIDTVIITHYHADHSGALRSILSDPDFTVGSIVFPGYGQNLLHADTTALEPAQKLEKEGRIRLFYHKKGDRIDFGSLEMECLWPPSDIQDPEKSPTGSITEDGELLNNYSAVYKLSYGAFKVMLMGDTHRDAEDIIADSGTDIRAALLKGAHHGRDTSCHEKLLTAVSPSAAVFMTKFKDLPVGKRLEEHHIRSLSTQASGNIVVNSDGHEMTILTRSETLRFPLNAR